MIHGFTITPTGAAALPHAGKGALPLFRDSIEGKGEPVMSTWYPEADLVIPVSYTHLDVYKRQRLPPLRLNRAKQKPPAAGTECGRGLEE